jgi:gamma-glutamyltranspeptidase
MDSGQAGYTFGIGRPPTIAEQDMITTPHYLASAVGSDTLSRGGSAVDACIAANATLAVVYNHMAGLGGDLFAQVWDPRDGVVQAINGSGRSGMRVTIDAYRALGWEAIEPRGPLAANTVPGTVDAWNQLHRQYGKLDWSQLFQPAITYAQEGFPVSQKYRDYVETHADTLRQYRETARVLLPNGAPPATGVIIRLPDLARSLREIAQQGARTFYQGDLMRRIVSGLRSEGGLLTEEDFAAHTSEWVEPLRTTYHGYEVTELPPNTQGIATLMLLNIIEGDDLLAMGDGTADYLHLMAEAIKLVFADRDRWVTDPTTLSIPYDQLLSKGYAAERRRAITMTRARPVEEIEAGIRAATAPGGDTVYLAAVDRNGQACSMIQSIYFEFGSAFIPEGTGILLQNRGSFFQLDPEHPNALAPRKRSFHTIIPAMALHYGRPSLLFGTMGGEGQPQTQVAMLTRILDFGYNPQEAVEAPRWLYGRTWGEQSRSLKLEGRFSDGVAAELRRRGHDVIMLEDWSQTMGHAQAILIDTDEGTLHGAADPRGDGMAIGH